MADQSGQSLNEQHKAKDVRSSNVLAAKAIADAVRTSLGPRGMDKMIQTPEGEVIISNDGATIMSKMEVNHPTAKMLVELSKAQDVEAGDGTTSVVVLCGSLLSACGTLLQKGIHPTTITESFEKASRKSAEILEAISVPVDLNNRDQMIKCVDTCLSSKVISANKDKLSPIAVDAVLNIIDAESAVNVDLNDIKIVKQKGGTIDDTELITGLCFSKGVSHTSGGPTRVANAKIGLIQFWLSAPKTDIDNSVVISDYAAMDRLLREERKYILGLCKKIKKAGCNVLLIQKSILRDAVNDLSLHFLAKMGIMVIKDVERTDVDFICRTVGCRPVAHVDSFTADKLGSADMVEECTVTGQGGSKVVKMTGVPNTGNTQTILIRGSNALVIEEADRSMHDALCVVRSLVKKRFLIVGGGAPEIEVALRLMQWQKTLSGAEAFCVKAFAEALEVIPHTLAENAGMSPINTVTELRAKHEAGEPEAGINVKTRSVSNMSELGVLQPLLVSLSSINLSTETVRMIMKIDDIVQVM